MDAAGIQLRRAHVLAAAICFVAVQLTLGSLAVAWHPGAFGIAPEGWGTKSGWELIARSEGRLPEQQSYWHHVGLLLNHNVVTWQLRSRLSPSVLLPPWGLWRQTRDSWYYAAWARASLHLTWIPEYSGAHLYLWFFVWLMEVEAHILSAAGTFWLCWAWWSGIRAPRGRRARAYWGAAKQALLMYALVLAPLVPGALVEAAL